MGAALNSQIDFLPREDWEKGVKGQIIKWALNIGRHLVIFVEFLVILALISRFKFDMELDDLNEEVKEKQAIVQSSRQFEKEFRFLAKRLQVADKLKSNQIKTNEPLDKLSSLVPIDVVFSDLNVSGEKIGVRAQSLSELGIITFLKNLKSSKEFEEVSLSSLDLGEEKEAKIKFSVDLSFSKK